MPSCRFFLAAALVVPLAAAPGHAEHIFDEPATGSVTGSVTLVRDGSPMPDRSGVVVRLEGVPGPPPAPMRATIRQHKKAFVPPLVVVTRGSTVDFPNDDKIFHNVFSLSRAARFDLGLYKSGTSKSVKLRRPGVVSVLCNIHPEMAALIKVVDTRYYAVTGRDGSFRIDGVPAGTYPLVAWQPYGKEHRGQVTIEPYRTAVVDIELQQGQKPTRHLRKDGTPYGRYR